MEIPNYQKLFKPVLQFYADGQEHELRDAVAHISDLLNLSQDQRAQTTSSGTPVIHSRVSWAHTYLRQAGLIQNVRRGVCTITQAGQKVLSDNPETLDNKYLMQFEAFVKFRNTRHVPDIDTAQAVADEIFEDKTPEERIDVALAEHNQALSERLIDELRNTDPVYFEKIVAELLQVMGYGHAEVTKRTNDGGVDAIVNEDSLGLSKIYVQAKRYAETNRVNGKELRDFVGALDLNGVNKGVFITTSYFHETAKDQLRSSQKSIILVDGTKLTELMIEHNVGVSTEKTYPLKRLDIDYFYSGYES